MISLRIKTLLFVLLAMLATAVYGQQMVIKDFEMKPNDLTAVNEATKVYDDNSEVCALIRIQTTQKGFSFDAGTVGVVKVEENHVAEVWIYVPAGLRRINIRHPQLGTTGDYYFPERLESARTYSMTLVSGTSETIITPKSTSQVFVLYFKPEDAIVEIDGVMVDTEDGTYSGVLTHGRHEYRLSSDLYHPDAGVFEIGTEKLEKRVELKPAHGWIEVKGPSGASVYIDSRKVGTAPMKSNPIASGSHDVRLTKEKYKPFREQVVVNDNIITTLNPTLVANFVTVTLVASGDAEIWVNGEKKGEGRVSVDLEPAEYTFETRKASHRSRTDVRNITLSSGGTINLPEPIAITGTLMVNVKPVGAKVMLDGKAVGESPLILDNVLVGSHEVVISKAGCADRRESVTVAEGQTTNVEGRLVEGQDVRLSCGVAGARWMVDGVDRGVGAEITVNLSYAEHSVKIKADEYVDFEERFSVGVGTASRAFAMQKVIADVLEIPVKKGVTIRMRLVEGGTFQMGSENGGNDEKPVHSVTLSDYYIGETEVTQALWKKVMGSNHPTYHKGENLPVEWVSWNDCQEFIKKLNKMTGRTFALPTEAQWEYAARGGNKSKKYKYSGSDNLDDVGWNWNNSGDRKTTGDWSKCEQVTNNNCQTHPVGTKQANELGLYDMSGNVNEWCSDWYGNNYYSNSPSTNPTGASSGSNRVLRGGSWSDFASFCRSTYRYNFNPDCRSLYSGLRLVLLF